MGGNWADRRSAIETSLFGFIWKHSKRDQITLLIVTLFLFPLLYLTLELPKQIINGAIDAPAEIIKVYGVTFTQIEYLMLLCGGFLLAVLGHGLLKMRINTMKGVLAERLLRRFRYTLIARILRFPSSYFERTSQGELVSMVTAESEPMGGLMGDAIAQPVLQAGQMLTILGFLFAQSFAFGMAACALIPLQAWLIPKFQRQINLLNKRRVIEVRALASEIGEAATGAATLRTNAGWRYRLAMITDRLGRLFTLRFEIYQKKFFMKFVNNFITQLTPLLFYSIGGYLVIVGQVSLGALVAALAAYKDLAGPWKELLAYYNQSADMSLRWEIITERFAPPGMFDDDRLTGRPDVAPDLGGDIVLNDVTVRDADGNAVLERVSTTLPGGALVGITAQSDEDRRAFAELMTRELLPASGQVRIGEHPLNTLHQVSLASGIGHATSRPVLFQGTFGDNLLMPIRFQPLQAGGDDAFAREAARTGNSPDPLSADWTDPARGGVEDARALEDHWCDVVERIGGTGTLFRRALELRLDAARHAGLARVVTDMRPRVAALLAERGLTRYVHIFDPERYCPALPVVENLLFATSRTASLEEGLAGRHDFYELVKDLGLARDLIELATGILESLRQIFGSGGTDHPLFNRTGLDPVRYQAVLEALDGHRAGRPLDTDTETLILSVSASVTAEQFGPAFPERIRDKIVALRLAHAETLRARMDDLFVPILTDAPLAGLTVLENALFGKISEEAGPHAKDVEDVVADVLHQEGAGRDVLRQTLDLPIAIGGANLPAPLAETLSVSRATIKRPQILVLDKVLQSFSQDVRRDMLATFREDLRETTIIYLSDGSEDVADFDLELEFQQGRLIGSGSVGAVAEEGGEVAADLARKVSALERSALFAGLDRKQLRLLAFGSRWYRARDGQYVFNKNDPPDSGAFMLIEGEADLLLPRAQAEDTLIATVGPGTLVGELGLIRQEPRALDMRAKGDILCLRIGREEFLAVVENDAATAFRLLQVVAGYVNT